MRIFLLTGFILFFTIPLFTEDTALSIARREIQTQCELIEKGDTAELKKHFTKRLQKHIVDFRIRRVQRILPLYKLHDLVGSAEETTRGGKRIIIVKMRKGNPLTTLVEIDGKWYTDRMWFK